MKAPVVDVDSGTMEWSSGSLGRYNTWMYQQITEAALTPPSFDTVNRLNALGPMDWSVNGNLLRKTLLPTGQMMLIHWLPPLLNFKQRQTLPFGISTIAIAEALPDPEAS